MSVFRTALLTLALVACATEEEVAGSQPLSEPTAEFTLPPGTDPARPDAGEYVADPQRALTGAWFSEGGNLSESDMEAGVIRIEATFNEDGTYEINTRRVRNNTASGTYEVDRTTSPASIILNQEEPEEATFEGIWSVSQAVLTWEVVQTDPDLGLDPATPSGGFGSAEGTDFPVTTTFIRP